MKKNYARTFPVWKWGGGHYKICDFCFQLNKSTFKKIEENGEKNTSEKGRATVIFSLKNEVGGLVKALKLFQVTQLRLTLKKRKPSNVDKTLYADIGRPNRK